VLVAQSAADEIVQGVATNVGALLQYLILSRSDALIISFL
jgi:hypothetical protein